MQREGRYVKMIKQLLYEDCVKKRGLKKRWGEDGAALCRHMQERSYKFHTFIALLYLKFKTCLSRFTKNTPHPL